MVLGFYENLQEDQVPPKKYWHSPKHLKEWFEAIEQKRADRAAGFEPIEDDEEMEQNELTKGLRD